ncbi:hypothetical protein [Limobrevibacterium gyesilva]|uniref:Uncharacterized protein n=1 Tax=Limobrevibacterium gyesilva TaxID=2991712 RepID=A0AA41YPL2_9PROT|nr:hypothetical protein [Limobrevibacterium gyesilva]MCW3477726.1 hypothetical protein [Limobrevibacterium gyesilva]
MADDIFLGLAALLAALWLATTSPTGGRIVFRLVALVVALPFGSLGTLTIKVLDTALAGGGTSLSTAREIVASVAVITLSRYAGSALAHSLQTRDERVATEAAASRIAASVAAGSATESHMHIDPARIQSSAQAVKAQYEATAPLTASAAALLAALGHILF